MLTSITRDAVHHARLSSCAMMTDPACSAPRKPAARGRTDQDLSRLLCGNVERGLREVPVEWLKSEWRRRGPLKRVQLTIIGCVGPQRPKCKNPGTRTLCRFAPIVRPGDRVARVARHGSQLELTFVLLTGNGKKREALRFQ
jgi:hypothetical protein